MPTYDYRCPNGHEFEKFFRKISDAEAALPCPECGATAERRVSGGAGLVFKGSGFYLTDYGKNAHRKSGAPSGDKGGEKGGDKAGGGAADKPADGGGTKSESKADTSPAPSSEKSGAASPKKAE